MKIKELKEILKDLNDSDEVISWTYDNETGDNFTVLKQAVNYEFQKENKVLVLIPDIVRTIYYKRNKKSIF